MKKLFGFMMVAIISICLTGCVHFNNTITCTQIEDDEKMVVTVTTDKNDKIIGVKMTAEMTAPSKEELDEGYSYLKDEIDSMNKYAGVRGSIKKKGLTVSMTINLDLNKVSDETLEILDFDKEDLNVTGTEFRKIAEEDGATCK